MNEYFLVGITSSDGVGGAAAVASGLVPQMLNLFKVEKVSMFFLLFLMFAVVCSKPMIVVAEAETCRIYINCLSSLTAGGKAATPHHHFIAKFVYVQ